MATKRPPIESFFTKTPQAKEPNYLERVAQDFQKRGTNITDIFNRVKNNELNPISAGLQSAGQIAAGAVAPVTEAVSPVIEPVVSKVVDTISDIPVVQKQAMSDQSVLTKIEEFKQKHPTAAADVEALLNLASLIPTQAVATKTADVITDATTGFKKFSPQAAIPKGNTVKDGFMKFIAPEIDDQTKVILKETPTTKFDEYISVAQKAAQDTRNITPFEHVADKMAAVTKQLSTRAKEVGKKKSEYMEGLKFGFDPFETTSFVQKLSSLKNKLTVDSDKKFVQGFIDKAKNAKTKRSVDILIDDIQSQLERGNKDMTIPSGSPVEKQLRGITGELNSELKSSLPREYAALNAKFSNLTKVTNALNKALGEVVDGVSTRGASLIKQFFSPSGRKAKELFEYIKKETGVDLAQDTTLAKYAMELFDDPRSRSLLEGIPTSTSSALNKLIDYTVEKTGLGKGIRDKAREGALKKGRELTNSQGS